MYRVLIFDDDTDILDLCATILRNKGFEVMTSTSSETAIDRISELEPDVILMDNWMPGITGAETIMLLKKKEMFQHIPVIFFTANNQAEKLSILAGADYYLQKPFDINAFVEIVNRAVWDQIPVLRS